MWSSFCLSQHGARPPAAATVLDPAQPGSLRERQDCKQELRQRPVRAQAGQPAVKQLRLSSWGTRNLNLTEVRQVWGDRHPQGPETGLDTTPASPGCPEAAPWSKSPEMANPWSEGASGETAGRRRTLVTRPRAPEAGPSSRQLSTHEWALGCRAASLASLSVPVPFPSLAFAAASRRLGCPLSRSSLFIQFQVVVETQRGGKRQYSCSRQKRRSQATCRVRPFGRVPYTVRASQVMVFRISDCRQRESSGCRSPSLQSLRINLCICRFDYC